MTSHAGPWRRGEPAPEEARPTRRAARSCGGRGLRRVGLLQARATAARRRRAGVDRSRAPAPPAPLDRARLRAALGPHAPRSRPAVPGRPAARRLHRHRRARRPGGDRQPAPAAISPALVATAAADAEVLHRLARRARPGPRAPRRGSARPPPRASWTSALPRDGALLRPHRPARAQRMCSTAGRAGLRRRRRGRRVARRWEARARARPGAGGRVRQLAAAARRRTGWESSRWACWLRGRPGPHRAARRPATPPTRPRLGAPGARHAAAVRAPRSSAWEVPRGSRSPTGSPARCPGRRPRRPRLPRLHAVPAGPPARVPRGALPRRAAGQAVGPARPRCSSRCFGPGASTDRRRQRLRAGRAAGGSRPPATAWPTASSPQAAAAVFELALRAPARPRRARALARRRAVDDHRPSGASGAAVCPADEPGPRRWSRTHRRADRP